MALLRRERSREATMVEFADVASTGVVDAVENVMGYENELLIDDEPSDGENVEVPLVRAAIVLLAPSAV